MVESVNGADLRAKRYRSYTPLRCAAPAVEGLGYFECFVKRDNVNIEVRDNRGEAASDVATRHACLKPSTGHRRQYRLIRLISVMVQT